MSIYYDLKRKAYLNTLGAVISALGTVLFLRHWWMIIGAVAFVAFTAMAVVYRIKASRQFNTEQQ
jgi:predicted neutral ceramidase superfamily lipid hydrolase